MSRIKNYVVALGSSYLAIGANIVYTLVSVPLALRYLANSEFGLWGLTLQICGYVALIDFGMAGVSRILIDYKDAKDGPSYGGVIQTSVAVSIAQAVLICVIGSVCAFLLLPVVRVPPSLQEEFVWLLIGQSGLLALTFVTRIFTYLLSAHQRQDILNYSQVGLFLANIGVLWLCFKRGFGVYSVLYAQLAGWVFATIVAFAACYKLRLFPQRGKWGKPTWNKFSEIFAYGRDIFLFVLGSQLIHASQIILITRELGLNAAAIWVICTRSFTVVSQLVYRIFDTSCPALAEMIVRGERGQLLHRFRSIVVISASAAVLAGTVFAVANQPFVFVWTDGKAVWSVANDALLAIWLVVTASARCHAGLVGQTKAFGFLRYLYLFEGIWFASWSVILLRHGGIVAMLLAAISGTLLFSLPYGTWRTFRYFNVRWRDMVWRWSWPSLRFALAMLLIALVVWRFTRPMGNIEKLLASSAVLAAAGVPLFFYLGLDAELRNEMRTRFLAKFRK
jgi:O-antigen/teichoic acid export membrane protein